MLLLTRGSDIFKITIVNLLGISVTLQKECFYIYLLFADFIFWRLSVNE
jgi:hypothetical protein